MLDGLQVSAAGGRLQGDRIDLIGYNLSRMTATGYRADYAAVQAQAVTELDLAQPGNIVTTPDFTEGTPIRTGRALDVALVGDGFLRTSDGQRTYYTRAGNLHVDAAGELAVASGARVLGRGGEAISVSRDQEVVIDSNGNVTQGGAVVGVLDRVKFADPRHELVRFGNDFVAKDPTVEPQKSDCEVAGGMRETSNVSAIRAMVELIESSRAFEANMRMIKYQDQTLGKLIAQVASVPV